MQLDAIDSKVGSIDTNGAVRGGGGAMEQLSTVPLNSHSVLKADRDAFIFIYFLPLTSQVKKGITFYTNLLGP